MDIISIIVMVVGIRGVFLSFNYMRKFKDWAKKAMFIFPFLIAVMIGMALISESRKLVISKDPDFFMKIALPIICMIAGVVYLYVSRDDKFLEENTELEYKVFFRILPRIKIMNARINYTIRGVGLLLAAIIIIYFTWMNR